MPRCVAIAAQSPGIERASSAATSARRLSLIRLAHRAELRLPAGPKLRVREDRPHDVRAVGRRVRVVDPDRDLDVALDRRSVGRGSGDHEHRPDALRVQRERLRERRRDEQLDTRPDELEQAGGILAQPVAEALVGEVDERQQPVRLDEVADRRHSSGDGSTPVGLWHAPCSRTTSPGAASVERLEHRGLVDPPAGRVRVRVRPDAEARGVEQLRVIRPGRLAHPQRLAGPGLAKQVRGDPQPARATRRLGGEGAPETSPPRGRRRGRGPGPAPGSLPRRRSGR